MTGKKNPETVLFFLGLTLAAVFFFAEGNEKIKEESDEYFVLQKSLAGEERISLEEYLPELIMGIMECETETEMGTEMEIETETYKAFAIVLRSNMIAASLKKNSRQVTYEEIGLETQNPEMLYQEWNEEQKEAYKKVKEALEETKYQILGKENELYEDVKEDSMKFFGRLAEVNEMAKNGSDHYEILHFFFPDCEIIKN